MTQNPSKPIPVILGPTASGKTSIGILLAKEIKGEVISVDSRKVYKGLPIGTATPDGTWEDGVFWVQGVAHHLMGHLSPNQPYTAGDFAKDADLLINEILNRGNVPLLVGGTGFYFKALAKGLPTLPPRDSAVRSELEQRLASEGLVALHNELQRLDPEAAQNISANDRHKVIRALEVVRLTGRPFSEGKSAPKNASSHTFVVMGLDFPKDLLEKRIEERSRKMVERGMIEEAAVLLKQGFSKTCPALVSFGYREAVEVIDGTLAREDFLPALIKGTKSYAKRQRTWFRTQIQPTWFEASTSSRKEEIALRMKAFLQRAN